MKLANVKYENCDSWFNTEYIPDNPRNIIIYTAEGGSAEGYYDTTKDKWFQYKWNCYVNPIAWREMPRYK